MWRPHIFSQCFLIFFCILLQKNGLKRGQFVLLTEKRLFLPQHLFSAPVAADVYNSQQHLVWFSSPARKGHPSASSQLNLLAHFFLSLSKADWSWNPQGLQETVSEQDLWVEVWGNAAAVRGSYRSATRLLVVWKSGWHRAKFQSWLRSRLLNKGSTWKTTAVCKSAAITITIRKKIFIHMRLCVHAAGFPPLQNLLVRADRCCAAPPFVTLAMRPSATHWSCSPRLCTESSFDVGHH